MRDLNSIKFNFSTVETHANQAKSNINLPWQEQNYYSSLSDIVNLFLHSCWKSKRLVEIMELISNHRTQQLEPYLSLKFNYHLRQLTVKIKKDLLEMAICNSLNLTLIIMKQEVSVTKGHQMRKRIEVQIWILPPLRALE